MLLKESDLIQNQMNIDLDTLFENEYCCTTKIIPIVENKRLNKNIIKIDDIRNFSESNLLTIDESINYICEDHNISTKSVSLSVKEEAYYANSNGVRDIVLECNTNGIDVCIIPYDSKKNDFYWMLEEAIRLDLESNELKYVPLIMMDESLITTVNGLRDKAETFVAKGINKIANPVGHVVDKAKEIKTKVVKGIENKVDQATTKVVNTVMDKGTAYVNDPNNKEKVDQAVEKASDMASNIAGKTINKTFDKTKNNIEDNFKKYLTGANIGVLGTILTAAGANGLSELNMDKIAEAPLDTLAKMYKTTKDVFGKLTGRAGQVPSDQKGIFNNIVNYLKSAMSAISKRLGMG